MSTIETTPAADARKQAAARARQHESALADRLAQLINDDADVVRLCKPLDEHAVWKQAAEALEGSHV